MNERTWDGVFGESPSKSAIAPHPSQRHLPDPNDEQHRDAIRYWIQFSDFYQMPHITYYNSSDDLVGLLENLTPAYLKKISELMRQYNSKVKMELINQWKDILRRIAKYSPNAPH
jgi:hypothetical protein